MNTEPTKFATLAYAPDPDWCWWPPEASGGRWSIDRDGGPMMPRKKIATFTGPDAEKNAKLAAKSVNEREALLAALRESLLLLEDDLAQAEWDTKHKRLDVRRYFVDAYQKKLERVERVRAAIALATGGATP